MATYTTSSGFSDLIGSMVVTNNNVDSYTSDTLGTTVETSPKGGVGLNFHVRFTSATPPRNYNIKSTANANGNGYSGKANNNSRAAAEESWSATATTLETADASAPDAGYGSAEAGDTKNAAS